MGASQVSLCSIILPCETNTRLDNYGVNMGLKQILLNRGQVGFQADFFILDA